MTSTRPDCGWAPLMGIWAAGGSVAPEQVHQESWDSAPRGTCPPAGGQQGPSPPAPRIPLCADPCGKIQKPEAPVPVRPHAWWCWVLHEYRERLFFSFSFSIFLKTTTSYNLKSCPWIYQNFFLWNYSNLWWGLKNKPCEFITEAGEKKKTLFIWWKLSSKLQGRPLAPRSRQRGWFLPSGSPAESPNSGSLCGGLWSRPVVGPVWIGPWLTWGGDCSDYQRTPWHEFIFCSLEFRWLQPRDGRGGFSS